MLTNDLKDYIKDQCGIPSVGIAPADDLSPSEVRSLEKVNCIMSTYTPLYASDTSFFQPRDFLDNAMAVIVLGINVFFGRPSKQINGTLKGEINNFYVNPECLNYINSQTEKVIHFLSDQGYTGMSLSWNGSPRKLMAARSGVGRYGRNAIIQNQLFGSWIALHLIVTDAPLEMDSAIDEDCGECSLCQDACPTGALNEPYKCNIERCLSLQLVHHKSSLSYEMRELAGTTITDCNACMDACPKNQKLPLQSEISFLEDRVYPEIAPLVNMTDSHFNNLFGDTLFEFILMGKKYLQRNAAVAIGNYGDPEYIPILIEALETQSEEIVRGPAAWALGRIGTKKGKEALDKFPSKDPSPSVRSEIEYALNMI